jgi:hypothetical protein
MIGGRDQGKIMNFLVDIAAASGFIVLCAVTIKGLIGGR